MSRRHPRQRREHLQLCIRCETPLHGAPNSNIAWHGVRERTDYGAVLRRYKPGPMCRHCTDTLEPNPNSMSSAATTYKMRDPYLRPELYTDP